MNSIEPLPLKKIGAIICDAREQKSISIESLAEHLCIHKERLVALEKGHEEFLPEKVYIIGMIRRVAEYLKINSDSLIAELEPKPLMVNKDSVIKKSWVEKLLKLVDDI